MKIGVLINLADMETLEEKLDMMEKENFDNCQLLVWKVSLFTPENAERVKALFAERNITISALWCGWQGPQVWNPYEGPKTLGLVPAEFRESRIKNLCDGGNFAKILGAKHIITHMGFIPENPNDPDFLPFCDAVRTVAEHLKKNGQYLLFETGQETPMAMLRCFETVGTDNLGVNLDTANLITYGKANPVDALDVFGKYVMGMHAKDGTYPTSGQKNGLEAPIGEGKVDFKGVLTGLRDLGYKGYVTIEREISGDQQIEDIRSGRTYLEGILSEIGCLEQ